ncbi:hypothetical protein Tco_0252228 [Tanacetum coccineum]
MIQNLHIWLLHPRFKCSNLKNVETLAPKTHSCGKGVDESNTPTMKKKKAQILVRSESPEALDDGDIPNESSVKS